MAPVTVQDTGTTIPITVTDIDGNAYETVKIGTQRWMTENLRSLHYANGDVIPYQPEDVAWTGLSTGAWVDYGADVGYDPIYGKLYNWYSVSDPRNVCPSGWHVPSDEDWMELEEVVGVPTVQLANTGNRGASANAGSKLKSRELWQEQSSVVTDSVGFAALPGGTRWPNGMFSNAGVSGNWWSSTEQNTNNAWFRQLWMNNAGITRTNVPKRSGASIRCVEDP